jgi:hypothetical protein
MEDNLPFPIKKDLESAYRIASAKTRPFLIKRAITNDSQ